MQQRLKKYLSPVEDTQTTQTPDQPQISYQPQTKE